MKKPNKTDGHIFTCLGCVWFFLFFSLYAQNNLSNASEENSEAQTSSLIVEFYKDGGTNGIASRCSGTYIAENRLLTAAHCFSENIDQLIKIKCSHKPLQAAYLLSVKKHREMDVAVAQVTNIDCHVKKINAIHPSEKQILHIYKDGSKKILAIDSIDAFTFKVTDSNDCLIQGDSGIMAQTVSLATKENGVLGMLIAGEATCPAIQTFLRFDLINEWLLSEKII